MKKFSLIIGLVLGLTLGACSMFYAADKDQKKDSWSQRIKKKLKGANSTSPSTSTPTPAPELNASARIDKVSGEVRVLRAGETELAPLANGDELFVGDIVMTREDSGAQITGSIVKGRRLVLSVGDGAIIVITKLYEDEEEEQRFFRMLQGGGGVTAEDFPKQTAAGSPRIGKKKKDYTTSSAIDMSDR